MTKYRVLRHDKTFIVQVKYWWWFRWVNFSYHQTKTFAIEMIDDMIKDKDEVVYTREHP